MKKYTVQRPMVEWVETVVQAESLEQALEKADKDFENGDYISVEMTFDIDFDRYWVQDEDGNRWTETYTELIEAGENA
jgi:hypothetical protein